MNIALHEFNCLFVILLIASVGASASARCKM